MTTEIRGETAPSRENRLDTLPSRPRLTTAQAAAHTLLVRRLKLILPIAAGGLLFIFLVNTGGGTQDYVLDDFADMNNVAEELRMAKPHFSGIDADGVPFDITAVAAVRSPNAHDNVALEKPKAISGDGDEKTTITAEKGDYSDQSNVLVLEENVVFNHQLGVDSYNLKTKRAIFAIDDETVTSNSRVMGEGPRGAELKADTMVADNKTQIVVFEGNVHTRIYPDRENTGCSTTDEMTDNTRPTLKSTDDEATTDTKTNCNNPLQIGNRPR
ncbi:MAG: LPS export ABC transporter periplasmic protein LptC [Pseudomonadota bacterium]